MRVTLSSPRLDLRSGWSTSTTEAAAYPPPLPLPQTVPPPGPDPFAAGRSLEGWNSTAEHDVLICGFGGYPPAPAAAAPPPPWRSPAGLVVPPPAAPELQTCDDQGFALNVVHLPQTCGAVATDFMYICIESIPQAWVTRHVHIFCTAFVLGGLPCCKQCPTWWRFVHPGESF